MNDCPPPTLISLPMMCALFGVGHQTVYRWNTNASRPGSRLPAPDLTIDGKPLWFEDTLREWAQTRTRKLTIREDVLDAYCQTQLLR